MFGFKGVFVVFAVACFACRVYTFRGFVYIEKLKYVRLESRSLLNRCPWLRTERCSNNSNHGRRPLPHLEGFYWTRLHYFFEFFFAQSLAYLGVEVSSSC